MKTIKQAFIAATFTVAMFASNALLAHSEHREPLSNSQSVEFAASSVREIAAQPKTSKEWGLDESWQDAISGEIVTKTTRFIVVSVNNPSQNKTLYLLMDGYGGIYNSNFTGQFSEVQ